jgi:hypothetical protein
MATKRLPRPRDPISLAKLIGDIATGQREDAAAERKDRAASELGRKGGTSRAKKLTPERRREIAQQAAKARYSKD